MDQSLIVGNMLSDSTGFSFKTVQKVVKEFMRPTRHIGKAQAYSFHVEKRLRDLVQWAIRYQSSRPFKR